MAAEDAYARKIGEARGRARRRAELEKQRADRGRPAPAPTEVDGKPASAPKRQWNDGAPSSGPANSGPERPKSGYTPPKPPGALRPGPAAPAVEDPEDKRHRHSMELEMFRAERDRERQDRDDAFRWAQLQQRSEERSQGGVRMWSFHGRLGSNGHSSLKVNWTGGRGSSGSSGASVPFGMPTYSSGYGARRPSGYAVSRSGSSGAGQADVKPLDWMPKDTLAGKEGARRHVRNDFTSIYAPNGTGRYQGGYLDPEFKRMFIAQRIGGLREGTYGYNRALTAATAAWEAQRKEYDAAFQLYGRHVMSEETRAAARRAKEAPVETVKSSSETAAADTAQKAGNAPVQNAPAQTDQSGQKPETGQSGPTSYGYIDPVTRKPVSKEQAAYIDGALRSGSTNATTSVNSDTGSYTVSAPNLQVSGLDKKTATDMAESRRKDDR